MKQTYNPGMREDVGLSQEIIEVPAPLDNEEATPRPMWQKLMPLGMLGLMGLMMYVMSQMGGRNMLMMAPMMRVDMPHEVVCTNDCSLLMSLKVMSKALAKFWPM